MQATYFYNCELPPTEVTGVLGSTIKLEDDTLAKQSKGFKATNARIDWENKKLVETTKDGVKVYLLDNIFNSWHDVEGVSLSISLNKDIEPDEDEY